MPANQQQLHRPDRQHRGRGGYPRDSGNPPPRPHSARSFSGPGGGPSSPRQKPRCPCREIRQRHGCKRPQSRSERVILQGLPQAKMGCADETPREPAEWAGEPGHGLENAERNAEDETAPGVLIRDGNRQKEGGGKDGRQCDRGEQAVGRGFHLRFQNRGPARMDRGLRCTSRAG